MFKSNEKFVSIDMSNKKLSYEEMEFTYQSTLETATKQLFEDFFKDHGWTREEFLAASVLYAQAIHDGRIQKWVN